MKRKKMCIRDSGNTTGANGTDHDAAPTAANPKSVVVNPPPIDW